MKQERKFPETCVGLSWFNRGITNRSYFSMTKVLRSFLATVQPGNFFTPVWYPPPYTSSKTTLK